MTGRVYLPWFHKSSDVECFSTQGPPVPSRRWARMRTRTSGRSRASRPRSSMVCPRPARASTTAWPPCRRWSRSRARSESRRVRPAGGRQRRCLMHLGIFAKTFPRPTLEETLDAIADHGLTHVQFNMSCVGLPTLPDRLDEDRCIWIARSFRERGLTMAAISGTFNLCDPERGAALRTTCSVSRCWPRPAAGSIRGSSRSARARATRTTCGDGIPRTCDGAPGTRLVEAMREAVKIADRHEVTLAFEPEINNVVNSVVQGPEAARRDRLALAQGRDRPGEPDPSWRAYSHRRRSWMRRSIGSVRTSSSPTPRNHGSTRNRTYDS